MLSVDIVDKPVIPIDTETTPTASFLIENFLSIVCLSFHDFIFL